jgi:hypothetical protein
MSGARKTHKDTDNFLIFLSNSFQPLLYGRLLLENDDPCIEMKRFGSFFRTIRR